MVGNLPTLLKKTIETIKKLQDLYCGMDEKVDDE